MTLVLGTPLSAQLSRWSRLLPAGLLTPLGYATSYVDVLIDFHAVAMRLHRCNAVDPV